jgi:hypothetical protein
MPPRSVTNPLWNAVTVAGATPVAVELWQVVQSVASVMLSWNVVPEGAKSQLSIDSWQLKQFAVVTVMVLAFASAPLLDVCHTLQLVM